jgi:hypothetical protein
LNETTIGKKALRQQRGDFVGAHGYKCACADGIVASHRTAGKYRDDGQKAAKRKPAVAAVGDGTVRAQTARALASFPSNQRASDSHDYTRLTALEEWNASLDETDAMFNDTCSGSSTMHCEPGSHAACQLAAIDGICMTGTCK